MKKKKFIYTSLITVTLLSACGSTTKEKEETKAIVEETVKTVKNQQKSDDFREQLKAQEPATEAQFQNWLPENIANFNRKEFTKTRISQDNIASAGAIYNNENDTKNLEIKIVDGASKDGLLAIQSHYMAQTLELNNVKPSQHEKTYEKNGLKVLETYVKKDEFYRVSFLYNMRFGITIENNGLSYDEVWQVIDALDLKRLNSL